MVITCSSWLRRHAKHSSSSEKVSVLIKEDKTCIIIWWKSPPLSSLNISKYMSKRDLKSTFSGKMASKKPYSSGMLWQKLSIAKYNSNYTRCNLMINLAVPSGSASRPWAKSNLNRTISHNGHNSATHLSNCWFERRIYFANSNVGPLITSKGIVSTLKYGNDQTYASGAYAGNGECLKLARNLV